MQFIISDTYLNGVSFSSEPGFGNASKQTGLKLNSIIL